MERRTCTISDWNCEAPAGWGTAGGYALGTVSTRKTCYVCGEPVCGACSAIVKWEGKRVRACSNCAPQVIVYRLQTEAGKGPYTIPRPSSTPWGSVSDRQLPPRAATYLRIEQDWAQGRYIDDGEGDPHPSPWEDGLRHPASEVSALMANEYCGFDSVESMRAWFFRAPHDPEALTAMGLFITVWQVPPTHVRKGGKQVVFVRREATLIGTYSPMMIDELPA